MSNATQGKSLEVWILAEARLKGILITKHDPGMYYLKAARAWVPCRKGWVDMSARLEGGRCADFDCKSTSSATSWALKASMRQGGHQLALLMRIHALGSPAFVFVRKLSAPSADYVVPVTGEGLPFEGASAKWARLDPYKLAPGMSWIDCVKTPDVWIAWCSRGLEA